MQVSILEVPYDSAHAFRRMGAGSGRLFPEIAEMLRQAGHGTAHRVVLAQDPFLTEITTSFGLYRQLAEHVRQAHAHQHFPLVLAGNCGATLGAVAGLPNENLGVIWMDAHGDFNTPETSASGFLDGMGLATLTGQCWRGLAGSIPGFRPVPPARVVHVGGRDFDSAELIALGQTGVQVVSPQQLKKRQQTALETALAELAGQVSACYLHVDLDVLDAERVGPANAYAQPGGLTLEQVLGVVATIQQNLSISGATLASYDPQVDVDGHVLAAALRIARQIVA